MRLAAAALLCLAMTGVARAEAPAADDPFQRKITLHARDLSLRDAIDRIALLAKVRISYSGDNLPLDRRVEVARDTATLGEVLGELLRPYPVQPVVVAADHIVLSPRERAAPDTLSRSIAVLDRVVVTGSVLGAPERPLPIALDVVPGREIERRDQTSLSQVFDGSVPGVFVWDQAPTSMLARYGSIRGASSFGLSFPKVYVDGIEVANPLLMTQISPELIERVEVIRGPQGAALYGAEAISGVINIVSRHDGTGADGANLKIRTEAGASASAFGPSVPVQKHALSARRGSNLKSAGLNFSLSTTGEYIPDASSREIAVSGDTRVIGNNSSLTASARFVDKNAGVPLTPLLDPRFALKLRADSAPQELRMYSLGSTATILPSEKWTYALTAGFDGYSLTNVPSESSPIPFFVDSALRAAGGSAVRGTMRGSAVTARGRPDRATLTFTVAAEQSVLRDRSPVELPPRTPGDTSPVPPTEYAVEWTSTTGVMAQANVAVREAVYFTAGLRNESIGMADGTSQFATLPMVGLSYVDEVGAVTTKWRAAYGRGVRGARGKLSMLGKDLSKYRVHNPNLEPEEQSGVEAGVDLYIGRRIGMHLTRFDQAVYGLVQRVALRQTGPGGATLNAVQLQNVGEISNRGWETQATLSLGALQLAGAATSVDSRVQRVSVAYGGELRRGDRVLGVPARTLSATATVARRRFDVSATLSRASDWVNYDRLRIAQCMIDFRFCRNSTRDFTNPTVLRQYWMTYDGNTRLRSAFAVELPRGFSLLATGENLLNHQRGEPDSITIVPGRTITLGLRARF